MKYFYLILALFSLSLLGSGCLSQPEWARYELCFGMSTDSGHARIADEQWQQFRDTEISSRFPDGYTVLHGNGYWKSRDVTYSEPSKILMVAAPDTQATQVKLAEIAAAFARKFKQECVLEIKSPAKVIFHSFK